MTSRIEDRSPGRPFRRPWRDRLLLWGAGLAVFVGGSVVAAVTGIAERLPNLGRFALVVIVAAILFENWRTARKIRETVSRIEDATNQPPF